MQTRVIVDEVERLSNSINSTAKSNNRYSYLRKEITGDGLDHLSQIFDKYGVLRESFEKVFGNLQGTATGILSNADRLNTETVYFEQAHQLTTNTQESFQSMNDEIGSLTKIVGDIKNDTDEIFSLALNASIVSSKYTHTSGVFDIIANKLNEMSNFIGDNLKNIIKVVEPITTDVKDLMESNSKLIEQSDDGFKSFNEFKGTLEKEKELVEKVANLKKATNDIVNNQFQMLNNLKNQLNQMSHDSDDAIKGSGNNIGWAEQLTVFAIDAKNILRNREKDKDHMSKFKKKLLDIKEIAHSIFLAGSTVYNKSKSQLEFSKTCMNFCDTIISESNALIKKVEEIDQDSKKNSSTITGITSEMKTLNAQIKSISELLKEGYTMVNKFDINYGEISNIIGFLRNIMKSMNLIGMLSRIESSREPEEYVQFMTISENIRKLQTQVHDSIPIIEENVDRTQTLIATIKSNFEHTIADFNSIEESTDMVNAGLLDTLQISADSLQISEEIVEMVNVMSGHLTAVRDIMTQMLEMITHPIEGGAFNRASANKIETICDNLIKEVVA